MTPRAKATETKNGLDALSRIKRLEEENAQLRADLGTFIHAAYPHMNTGAPALRDLKARYSPDALERRPFEGLPEQREKVNV